MPDHATLSLMNVLDPEHIANPYPLYQQLRSDDPVRWDEGMNAWVVTGYAEVVPALRDNRLTAVRFMIDTSWFPAEMQEMLNPVAYALTRQMLFLDPPDHTRLRSLAVKAFTPRVLEAMRGRIQQIVDELLDAVQAQGHMNVILDFAYPLPCIVIAEILGVPPEDRNQFTQWSGSFGTLLGSTSPSAEVVIPALQGVAEFIEYFRKLIAQRRTAPRDDLMQALINAEEQGDRLTEEELLSNCILLLAAGHGTTTHLLGNGTLALLRNPEQFQILRDDPSIISLAVMELLRYDSPVQLTSRVVREDMRIGDKQISAGQEVVFILGAANHDPAQFREPDRLNLRRQENRHLSFGQGIHYCLGAPLARLEAEIAFSTLARRLKNPQLETNEPKWGAGMVFRGLQELPISFM